MGPSRLRIRVIQGTRRCTSSFLDLLRLQVNKDFSDFGIKFLATSSYSIIDLPTAIIFLRCCDSQECSSNGDTYMSRPVQHRLQRKTE